MVMSIITLSRGTRSGGRGIAEDVARRLGYACISRDILLDASEIFNAPQLKLHQAIHDAPSLLDRFTNGKERYIAFVRAALLRFLREDNVVYHGLAGHFFVKDIGHCLKVRIIADMEDRVRGEMECQGLSEKEAVRLLTQDDAERRRWSQWLYGIDTSDPSLYDLVLHLGHVSRSDAADIICHTVNLPTFRPTPASLQALNDLAVAAEVHAALVEDYPTIDVTGKDGKITIYAKLGPNAGALAQENVIADIRARIKGIPGVETVEVRIKPVAQLND